jgi:hypothetical protein
MIFGYDVWIMKEFGNKDSWTNLFNACIQDPRQSYGFTGVIHILEDDQVLLQSVGDLEDYESGLIVYNFKCILYFITFQKSALRV